MPLPSLSNLPPSPTSEQITQFVVDAASEVIQTVTNAASSAQNTVESTAGHAVANVRTTVAAVNTATQAAFNDLRANTDRAKHELQSSANRAIADFQTLMNEVLKRVGQPPALVDFAIGDVNGEPFYEPLGCFGLFMKAVAENRNPITVRLREPNVAHAFRDFVGATQEEIARKAREKVVARIPQSPVASAADPATAGTVTAIIAAVPPAVWIILALALLVIAVAVSLVVVLMAIAVIVAVFKGYSVVGMDVEYDTPLGGTRVVINLSR